MDEADQRHAGERRQLGLCATCQHLRRQDTRRGTVFYRCLRADEDDRFMQYPPIPVLRCRGHEPESQ